MKQNYELTISERRGSEENNTVGTLYVTAHFDRRVEAELWAAKLREFLDSASAGRAAESAPKPAAAQQTAPARGDWVSPPAAAQPAPETKQAEPPAAAQPAQAEHAATPVADGEDDVPEDIIAAKKPRDVLVLLRDKYGLTKLADMIEWSTSNAAKVPCFAGETDLVGRLKRAAAVAGIR